MLQKEITHSSPKTFIVGMGLLSYSPIQKKYSEDEKIIILSTGKINITKHSFLSFGIISFYVGNHRCWPGSYTAFFHRITHCSLWEVDVTTLALMKKMDTELESKESKS